MASVFKYIYIYIYIYMKYIYIYIYIYEVYIYIYIYIYFYRNTTKKSLLSILFISYDTGRLIQGNLLLSF